MLKGWPIGQSAGADHDTVSKSFASLLDDRASCLYDSTAISLDTPIWAEDDPSFKIRPNRGCSVGYKQRLIVEDSRSCRICLLSLKGL